ncbi:related to vesicular integral-membrane protein VIP36 [Melanopsichium pennsylvanicum]|uniref:Related to vesicular integral-membrane protein VIP36 n=2 Tax=Melanopsichium pennsylvanicum TaxID=63383 RepID=A0AAJ4XGG0_9BASI|nr:related to vesicular integral-membrane protein VIP36 [Melanopsichium pennsylvanicum 4]SNX82010.1 related to vesicular integral-membrane protein VIP36 [Melanopsichium pennsylvanicum]
MASSYSRSSTTMLTLLISALLTLLQLASFVSASAKNIQMREMGSDAIVPLRSHSLYAPYVDSNLQNKFWDFGADSIVDTNKHIRLTQDRPSQMGWLWSRLPLTAENFEIVFEFKVDGHAHHIAGDGMALWLTQDRAKPGPVFGSINYFTGLGLFFDTYPNSRHTYSFPRISLMNGNGVEAYENVNDGARQEVAGCSIDFRIPKVATKAKLIHVKDVYTELLVHHTEWDHWESCFKLDNITLPLNPYLGFSALTGDVSDNHDVVSVTTSNIVYRNRTPKQLREEKMKHFPEKFGVKPKQNKGWSFGGNTKGFNSDVVDRTRSSVRGGFIGFILGVFGFLFWLVKWGLILAAIGALIMLGLQYYKRQNMKRF